MTRRFVPPSDKMWNFIFSLAAERNLPELGDCDQTRRSTLEEWRRNDGLDKFEAMHLIDRLKTAPFDTASTSALVPGVYRHNGTIYVVKPNRTNSDRLHARRLVEIGGRRLNAEDEVVHIEFEYDREALLRLRPEDQMTLEEARPFIIRYGKCIYCDTVLRDARSVERGVGPVCARRFAPPRPPAEVSPESRERLSELLARFGR